MIAEKILVLASTFPRWRNDTEPGFVYDLSRLLAKKGASVAVLAPHHFRSKAAEVIEGIRVYRFPYFIPFLQKLSYDGGINANMSSSFVAKLQVPFFLIAELLYTALAIKKEKPGIVHAHWIIPQGFVAAVVKKLFNFRFKLVITSHAGDVFILKNRFLRFFAGFALKSADAVTANSSYTAAAVKKICNSDVSVIPMGVDLQRFSKAVAAASVRKKYGKPVILFVGRLAEKKGVSYLISAMPVVAKKYPDATLLIIGNGPEKSNLVALAGKLQVHRSIRFLGGIPNSELPKYYSAADVFVLPSIIAKSGDTEGLGVVLLEALASGVPVVASAVGGISDVIISGKTGILVPQKDSSTLAAAIVNLLKNKSLRKQLVRNGKSHVKSNYSWAVVSDKFFKLFQKL